MLAMNKNRILGATAIVIAATVVLSSCKDKRSTGWEYAPNMYEHIAYDPDQANPNFKDGKTAQVPPAGTIPVGFVKFDYPNTKEGYELAGAQVKSPLFLTSKNIEEGKVLFTSFCSPCHGQHGQGDGEVVAHGFPAPPSYSKGQSSRGGNMSDLTDGKIYHTITYGVNAMGSYASQLSPEERWKVVMYVHQLQKTL
ncbi:quinol:cytochrome c oxidoreductase monoheme cytochrome subunit [Mucilaginibacter yixingensis]|uniref:Quinol:cytochrome c oxidoreductase monoheme cytochrome subunit n=1 Tax=Mucilaginibacter yixingensis TaxID=1295612 RepID=A0A2T5J746_9SPHI|nr:cytochrome c [Mucilaginibacter yixingensis]PTQ94974.1 quinol:cytochrome c oxidoreductase monoheme cytochrome subunit [Mucilaginibacter yixingensis]